MHQVANAADRGPYILEFRGISKSFPGVRALNDVSFGIKPGCVHVLIGENGAGKSTLLKIINGLYKADQGEVLFHGQPLQVNGPADALKAGVSMIYQELNTIPEMTVLQNLYLGREKTTAAGTMDDRGMKEQAKQFMKQQGLSFDLDSKMKSQSIASAQMLEIVKAISVDAKVILMDEPTSSLTENEVKYLFEKIRELKAAGITVVYISHKMEEVFAVGDYISVLRDGEHIGTLPIEQTDVSHVIEMMVGRKMTEVYPAKTAQIGEPMLRVEGFSRKGVFRDVSFEVRSGEILGISGLIGAGRTEIVRAILGMDAKDSGEVYLKGDRISIKTVNDAVKRGIVLVPEDRRRQGLNLIATVGDNLSLVSLKHVFDSPVLKRKGIKALVQRLMEELRIKAPSAATRAEKLSGGNQQKVVLGKWLSVSPKVLFLDEPTRGIDVGTKYEIYKLMCDMCAQGHAIILIDSDLEELMGMSDRVLVIREGEVAGELQKHEINANAIMQLAAVGGKVHEQQPA